MCVVGGGGGECVGVCVWGVRGVCVGGTVWLCVVCVCMHVYTRKGFLSQCLDDASTNPLPSEAAWEPTE